MRDKELFSGGEDRFGKTCVKCLYGLTMLESVRRREEDERSQLTEPLPTFTHRDDRPLKALARTVHVSCHI